MGKQNVSCSEAKEKIKEQVMLSIDMTAECDDALLEEIIDSALADCAWYIPYRDKVRIEDLTCFLSCLKMMILQTLW